MVSPISCTFPGHSVTILKSKIRLTLTLDNVPNRVSFTVVDWTKSFFVWSKTEVLSDIIPPVILNLVPLINASIQSLLLPKKSHVFIDVISYFFIIHRCVSYISNSWHQPLVTVLVHTPTLIVFPPLRTLFAMSYFSISEIESVLSLLGSGYLRCPKNTLSRLSDLISCDTFCVTSYVSIP